MGQEINTKISQIVAKELGLHINDIRVESANTKCIGNASPTAASSGTDINGNAALKAATELKDRLTKVAVQLLKEKYKSAVIEKNIRFDNRTIYATTHVKNKLNFPELVKYAYLNQTDLGVHAFYKTPSIHMDHSTGKGSPFFYFVFGAGLVQVEIDTLTGNHKMLKAVIVHETARSINSSIDEGQIAGAFFQGYGLSTLEKLDYDASGRYTATTPSTYKIPSIRELPDTFDLIMLERERKHVSVMGSKGIGEPPLMYGEAAYFAIKDAIASIANDEKPVTLTFPATGEAILEAIEHLNNGGTDI